MNFVTERIVLVITRISMCEGITPIHNGEQLRLHSREDPYCCTDAVGYYDCEISTGTFRFTGQLITLMTIEVTSSSSSPTSATQKSALRSTNSRSSSFVIPIALEFTSDRHAS